MKNDDWQKTQRLARLIAYLLNHFKKICAFLIAAILYSATSQTLCDYIGPIKSFLLSFVLIAVFLFFCFLRIDANQAQDKNQTNV